MAVDEKKRKMVQEFLVKNKVLIVDKTGSSRRRLVKTINDLGAKSNQTFSVTAFGEAKEIVTKDKPQLIICDYMIAGGSGFDLFKFIRESYPKETNKMCLILVTSNISQTAVAKAAEEDVDSFIIKPYTVQSFEENIINTIVAKIYPTKYMLEIENGKILLEEGKPAESIPVFENAAKLDPKPSLALYYIGQAKYMMQVLEDSKASFNEGLKINNIHFKCQMGLYTIFKNEKMWVNAYKVIRNIAKYFPASAERLKEVVHLCIKTNNYPDLEEYYNLFLELDDRPEDVIIYVCSGMYILGKWNFMEKNTPKGKEIYEKLVVSCAGNTKVLRSMITVLSYYGEYQQAQKYLSRFQGDATQGQDFLIAACYAECGSLDPNQKMKTAVEVYNSGCREILLFEYLIESFEVSNNVDKAKPYLDEVKKLYPDKDIRKLSQSIQKKAA